MGVQLNEETKSAIKGILQRRFGLSNFVVVDHKILQGNIHETYVNASGDGMDLRIKLVEDVDNEKTNLYRHGGTTADNWKWVDSYSALIEDIK